MSATTSPTFSASDLISVGDFDVWSLSSTSRSITPIPETPAQPRVPESHYGFSDKDLIVLQVGGILYRAPYHVLRHSAVFRDQFDWDDGRYGRRGSSDQFPIILDKFLIRDSEMEAFLTIVDMRVTDVPRSHNFLGLTRAMKLAKAWGFEDLQKYLVRELEEAALHGDPLQVIETANIYEVEWHQLHAAYKQLVDREAPLSPTEEDRVGQDQVDQIRALRTVGIQPRQRQRRTVPLSARMAAIPVIPSGFGRSWRESRSPATRTADVGLKTLASTSPRRHPTLYESSFVEVSVSERTYNFPSRTLNQSEASIWMAAEGHETSHSTIKAFLALAEIRVWMSPPELTLEQWTNLLGLATKCKLGHARRAFIDMMEPSLPDNPVEVIQMADRYQVNASWLLPQYALLCERRTPLSGEEASNLDNESVSAIQRVRDNRAEAIARSQETPASCQCESTQEAPCGYAPLLPPSAVILIEQDPYLASRISRER